jgi:hypothetical protein
VQLIFSVKNVYFNREVDDNNNLNPNINNNLNNNNVGNNNSTEFFTSLTWGEGYLAVDNSQAVLNLSLFLVFSWNSCVYVARLMQKKDKEKQKPTADVKH